MKQHSIFRLEDATVALLREASKRRGVTMTAIVEAALSDHLPTPYEGERLDNPLPVALQLDHLDASFFDIHVGEKSVWGKFEAHDVQPFEVSLQSVMDAAYQEGLLTDVSADGTVWNATSPPDGMSGREWVEYFLDQFPGTTHFFRVFKIAVEEEFATELHEIAVRLSSFTGRVEELRLTEVLQAARDLTRIAGAVQKDLPISPE